MHSNPPSSLGLVAACWAIAGWSAVLALAIGRLSATAVDGLAAGLTAPQVAVLVANTALLAWAEGHRGFQQRFSPRAAARVLWLRRHATPVTALLAPAFCIGFFGTTPRVLRMTWVGTALIVLAVVLVQRLAQPWRGVVDAGVVVGLGWGLVSFLVLCRSALRDGRYPADPAVPPSATP
jgi:uncharacterized membrane protein YedE/YeeE